MLTWPAMSSLKKSADPTRARILPGGGWVAVRAPVRCAQELDPMRIAAIEVRLGEDEVGGFGGGGAGRLGRDADRSRRVADEDTVLLVGGDGHQAEDSALSTERRFPVGVHVVD